MKKLCILTLTLLGSCTCVSIPKAGPVGTTGVEQQGTPPITLKINATSSNQRSEIPSLSESGHIIDYKGYTVLYNSEWLIPSWVAYELTSDETTGPYSRKGKDFQQDLSLLELQADAYDYRGSGWSRGHMAPAADFKWSDEAMTETFYYTNICPQDKDLNNRYWNTLENKVRSWANQFGSVYVVTGPVIGKNIHGKIGSHGVLVPDAFFKAILARTEGGWTSIAFVMENTPDSRLFKDCATTVNTVEALTGLDLFTFLDDSVEESVEDLLDYKTWRVY